MDERHGGADEISGTEPESEIVASTRRFVVMRGAEVYSLWPAKVASDEPLATFPLTDAGIDDAMEELAARTRAVRWAVLIPGVLRWGLIASAVAWALLSLAYNLGYALFANVIGGFDNHYGFLLWTFQLSKAAMGITGALLAISIANWIGRNPRGPGRR